MTIQIAANWNHHLASYAWYEYIAEGAFAVV